MPPNIDPTTTNLDAILSSQPATNTNGNAPNGEASSIAVDADNDPNNVLMHISNLCNHVLQKSSLTTLRTMRVSPRSAHLFSSVHVLFSTYRLLSTYYFRLPARRFLLFDLFNAVNLNMHTLTAFDHPFAPLFIKSTPAPDPASAAASPAAAATAAPPQPVHNNNLTSYFVPNDEDEDDEDDSYGYDQQALLDDDIDAAPKSAADV